MDRLTIPSFEMVLSPELLKRQVPTDVFDPPPHNRSLGVPVKRGIVLTGAGRYFTHPFYCMNMLVQPIEHKPERVLKPFSTNPQISKDNGYLLVSCAKHRLLQFL